MYNGTEVCFPEGGDTPEQCAPIQTPVSAALSTLMQDGQVRQRSERHHLPFCTLLCPSLSVLHDDFSFSHGYRA